MADFTSKYWNNDFSNVFQLLAPVVQMDISENQKKPVLDSECTRSQSSVAEPASQVCTYPLLPELRHLGWYLDAPFPLFLRCVLTEGWSPEPRWLGQILRSRRK